MDNTFFIPKNSERNFLLKLFCKTVPPMKRDFFNHRHLQFEIVIFKEGCGVYKTKHHSYTILPGDVFVFASDEIHCITEINSKTDLIYTNIQFEPRYIMGTEHKSLSSENFSFCFHHRSRFQNRLPRNNPSTDKIRELILLMENEFRQKNSEYELMVRLHLMNILIILIRDFHYSEEINQNRNHYNNILKTVYYIDENITNSLSLKDLSEFAGLSPNYFSTVFKQINGVSLWDYITAKRVELATHLINNCPEKTMLDIAVTCGFNNTANFNKMFKKHTGLTPSQYKKEAPVL